MSVEDKELSRTVFARTLFATRRLVIVGTLIQCVLMALWAMQVFHETNSSLVPVSILVTATIASLGMLILYFRVSEESLHLLMVTWFAILGSGLYLMLANELFGANESHMQRAKLPGFLPLFPLLLAALYAFVKTRIANSISTAFTALGGGLILIYGLAYHKEILDWGGLLGLGLVVVGFGVAVPVIMQVNTKMHAWMTEQSQLGSGLDEQHEPITGCLSAQAAAEELRIRRNSLGLRSTVTVRLADQVMLRQRLGGDGYRNLLRLAGIALMRQMEEHGDCAHHGDGHFVAWSYEPDWQAAEQVESFIRELSSLPVVVSEDAYFDVYASGVGKRKKRA